MQLCSYLVTSHARSRALWQVVTAARPVVATPTQTDGGHRGSRCVLDAAIDSAIAASPAAAAGQPTLAAPALSAAALTAHHHSAYGPLPRLARASDALLKECKTPGCTYGQKPAPFGGSGTKGQWKCGGVRCGCNKTAYCTQCHKGGQACANGGVCFVIADATLLGR